MKDYFERTTLTKVIEFFKSQDMAFRYNELKDVIEISEQRANWVHLDDRKVNDILLLIIDSTNDLKKEFKTTQKLRLYIENSFTSPSYNSIRECFNNLIYDGEDHIAKLLECLTIMDRNVNVENTIFGIKKYLLIYIRVWLRGCVASFYNERGNQVMLLLLGDQGIYKTTFINALIPPEIKDTLYTGHIIPSLKENFTCDLLAEKFLINIDDQVEELLGQKFQEIKSVVTSDYVNNRKVYRRDSKRRKRIANFAGSANSRNIFTDYENRRYLTIEVLEIDIDKLQQVNITQVWAQAKYEFDKGCQFHFGKVDIQIFNAINDEYSTKSLEQEFLLMLFHPASPDDPKVHFMQINQILKVIKKYSGSHVMMQRLINAWKKLGYPEKISKRVKGNPYPVYVYPIIRKYVDDGIEIRLDESDIYE